jgi:hypothetical protein
LNHEDDCEELIEDQSRTAFWVHNAKRELRESKSKIHDLQWLLRSTDPPSKKAKFSARKCSPQRGGG